MRLYPALIAVVFLVSCAGDRPIGRGLDEAPAVPAPTTETAADAEEPREIAEAPVIPPGDFPTATPEDAGFDPAALAEAVDGIRRMSGTRLLLVTRGGRLVVEEAWGAAPDRPVNVKSASKSLLSALVGIALERGDLEGLDQPIAELLPGRASGAKGAIALRDLLTMSSGLRSVSGEGYGAWVSTSDWTAAALAQPLVGEPGAAFEYSTGDSHLVAAVLAEATGTSVLAYAREHLLEPLGIEIDSWERAPEGVHLGGNQVSLTPLDLARFGQLYLNRGRWGDRQLVPAEWVETSTRVHAEGWPDRYGAYGYLWWIRPEAGAYMAVGYGGQFLYLAPADDLAIVLIATLEGKGEEWDRELLARFEDGIRGALRSGS